ncbi:MAG: amino-acid N-acetyltransferase [Pseudomonadota bacterium]
MKDNDFDITGFRNAAPYINAHREHTFVIAFAGEAIEAPSFPSLIHDIALLHNLGIRLILVHGARPQIEVRLKRIDSNIQYYEDLRVTDDKALAAVQEAVGCVRVEIESLLSMGLANTPMSGMRLRVCSGNFVTAKPLGIRDGIDYLHTGIVRKVDAEAIDKQLDQGNIVLLSPLGYSPTGETFNLRATDVATAAAMALAAHKLIYLMEEGAYQADRETPPRQLSVGQAQNLLSTFPELGNLLGQYLESAVHACSNNVGRVHLLERCIDGALLKELYTRDGTGILITAQIYEGLREAVIDDAGGLLELMMPLERAGVLVRRSREQLELEIKHFWVIERDGMIIACAALYPFIKEGVGELACLIVHPDYRGNHRGESLFHQLENKALGMGLKRLFVLTTQTAHWFLEQGFVEGDIDSLPVKRRSLYNYQRKSKVFFKSL